MLKILIAAGPAALVSWMIFGLTSAQAQPSVDGLWSGVINWPIEAIHASLLPTGKIMVWQTWTESVGLWDPLTQQFSAPALPDCQHLLRWSRFFG